MSMMELQHPHSVKKDSTIAVIAVRIKNDLVRVKGNSNNNQKNLSRNLHRVSYILKD